MHMNNQLRTYGAWVCCMCHTYLMTIEKQVRRAVRNHSSSRPASTACLSIGTSWGPLVCLCYTRAATHASGFQSARVIVVVLPLPSVQDVFPSLEPTAIVNTCIQFAGFEQNWHFEEIYCFVVYPSNCHVIILCDVGGGFHCFSSPIVLPESGSSPPLADWPTH